MSSESAAQRVFVQKEKGRIRFIRFVRIGILVLFLLLWELLARLSLLDSFLLSSPSRMGRTFLSLASTGELFLHIGTTLLETVIGFLLGTCLGIALATLFWWSETLSKIFDPYLVVLNALPKIALGPVLIVWIGAGMPAIILMSLLVSVIVTQVTVLNGFLSVEQDKITLLRAFGASKLQCFTRVVFPGALPVTLSALKISIGMSWVGVIVGEFLVSRAGLGYLIVYGGQVFRLDLVMMGTMVLCLLAAGMYLGVAALEKKLSARLNM